MFQNSDPDNLVHHVKPTNFFAPWYRPCRTASWKTEMTHARHISSKKKVTMSGRFLWQNCIISLAKSTKLYNVRHVSIAKLNHVWGFSLAELHYDRQISIAKVHHVPQISLSKLHHVRRLHTIIQIIRCQSVCKAAWGSSYRI